MVGSSRDAGPYMAALCTTSKNQSSTYTGTSSVLLAQARQPDPTITHMSLEPFIFKDFSGGWNVKDSPFGLDDNESGDLLNVVVEEGTAIGSRKGRVLKATALASLDNLYFWDRPSGGGIIVASEYHGATQRIVTFDPFNGTRTEIHSGVNGTTWHFQRAISGTTERLYCVNGSTAPQYWDGVAATTSSWAAAVPYQPRRISSWKNRVVILDPAAPARLRFSNIADPHTFTAADFLDVKSSDEGADDVVAIRPLGDYLIVIKEGSVWRLFADIPNLQAVRVGRPGGYDALMDTEVDGRIYFWNTAGLWSTDGLEQPVLESEIITPWIEEARTAHVSTRVSSSLDGRVFIATSKSGVRWLLEFQPRRRRQRSNGFETGLWLKHNLPFHSMCRLTDESLTGFGMLGGQSDGKLYEFFSGLSDAGTAIESYWHSSWKSFHPEEPFERIRRLNVHLAGSADFNVYQDFNTTTPTFTGSLSHASTPALGYLRPEKRGRYHRVKVGKTSSTTSWDLYALELVVRGGKEHR